MQCNCPARKELGPARWMTPFPQEDAAPQSKRQNACQGVVCLLMMKRSAFSCSVAKNRSTYRSRR